MTNSLDHLSTYQKEILENLISVREKLSDLITTSLINGELKNISNQDELYSYPYNYLDYAKQSIDPKVQALNVIADAVETAIKGYAVQTIEEFEHFSQFWSGYCHESELQGKQVRMRLNTNDFYESEETGLQICVLTGVQAIIMNFRGEGKFRTTITYADDIENGEILSPQTTNKPPFNDGETFQSRDELNSFIQQTPRSNSQKNVANDYGPDCSSDNLFTRKARFSQSWYRLHRLEVNDYGVGPNKNSVTKWGNMLSNGDVTGKNFILSETFEYARLRVKEKKTEETIDAYRLFNNMLSSMPLCFNLFHPLMLMLERNEAAVNTIFQKLFPTLRITIVNEIKIEFVPSPIGNYLGDKSGMDAAILYSNTDSQKGIIAIETKYIDKLGTNSASNASLHNSFARQLNAFTDKGLLDLSLSSPQIIRNFLSLEKYKSVAGFHEAYSVILSHAGNPYTEGEVRDFKNTLNADWHYKVIKCDLDKFVSIIKANCSSDFTDWINKFEDRYLVNH